MDKPKITVSFSGEVIPKDALNMMKCLFETFSVVKDDIKPPKDLREFEDRFGAFVCDLRKHFFGGIYDVGQGKTLKRKKDDETLLDALCSYDKFFKNRPPFVIEEGVYTIPYDFLRLVIERDAPLVVCEDIHLLGIERDRSGLSSPQKNMIAVQVAAQILWYLEKNKIPTIEVMKKKLLDKKFFYYNFLKLNRFPRPRTIEEWITQVFPVPKKLRKGKPSNSGVPEHYFNRIIPVPGIFLNNYQVINFQKFRFAIKCIAKILLMSRWSIDQILTSKFIQFYRKPLKIYLQMYVDGWIHDAVIDNRRIFDP